MKQNLYKIKILTLILAFTIILLLFIINRKSNNIFLTKKDSKNVIINSKYFSFFNKNDFKLRNCKNINDCQIKYENDLLEWNQLEKNKIKNILNKNIPKLKKYHNIYSNIKLIKSGDYIENGLPHTRLDTIVIPKKHLDVEYYDFFSLIAHEQFHIFQRFNPELFNDFYINSWNLLHLKHIPKKIMDISRGNPDALPDKMWGFKVEENKYILPICVYLKNSNKITDTKNIYFSYRIENGKEFFYRLNEELEKFNTLASNKKYISYFGEYNSNYYHPNEISASLFEILVECELEKKTIPKIPAIIKLEKFLN